jgi:hypothetical protein
MHWLKPFFSGGQPFPYRKEVGGKNDCTQLEVFSKPQIRLKGKAQTYPPSLKSYGGTGEKAKCKCLK